MNLNVLLSLASVSKGTAFIATTIQDVISKNTAVVPELSDAEILGLISQTVFAVLGNREARHAVEMYLIQLHASQLYVKDLAPSHDVCMRIARADVQHLLCFSNLDLLGHFIWSNRYRFIPLWKSLIDQPDQPYERFVTALDASLDMLKAA
jgi:hypothetical protein